jgi:hypothetical protein
MTLARLIAGRISGPLTRSNRWALEIGETGKIDHAPVIGHSCGGDQPMASDRFSSPRAAFSVPPARVSRPIATPRRAGDVRQASVCHKILSPTDTPFHGASTTGGPHPLRRGGNRCRSAATMGPTHWRKVTPLINMDQFEIPIVTLPKGWVFDFDKERWETRLVLLALGPMGNLSSSCLCR